MVLQKGTLNGYTIVEDSGSPGVPVTDVTGDGGDIVASSAAALARRNVRNVLDFGVVADGSTNNATALTSLIASLPASGGTIYFPAAANAYVINSTVTIVQSNIVFIIAKGATIKSTTFSGVGGTDAIFRFWTGTAVSNITFTGGGKIDGNASAPHLFLGKGAHSNIRVTNLELTNSTNTCVRMQGDVNGTETRGTATFSEATDTFTATAHGLTNGQRIYIYSDAYAPFGSGVWYYVVNAAANTFQLSGESGGTVLTGAQDDHPNLRYVRWPAIMSSIYFNDLRVSSVHEGIEYVMVDCGEINNNFITDVFGQDGIETANCKSIMVNNNLLMNGAGPGNGSINPYNDAIDCFYSRNVCIQTTMAASRTGIDFAAANNTYAKIRCSIDGNKIAGTFATGINLGGSIYSGTKITNNVCTVHDPISPQGQGILFHSGVTSNEGVTLEKNDLTNCFAYSLRCFGSPLNSRIISVNNKYGGNTVDTIFLSTSNAGRSYFISDLFTGTSDTGQVTDFYINAESDAVEYTCKDCIFENDQVVRVCAETSTTTGGKYINCEGMNSDVVGTATVASGTTSIAVTHTLGDGVGIGKQNRTPNYVFITPQGSLGSATKFWVSGINSTQFTINVDVNPGVNVIFAWRATWI